MEIYSETHGQENLGGHSETRDSLFPHMFWAMKPPARPARSSSPTTPTMSTGGTMGGRVRRPNSACNSHRRHSRAE